jgi:hypothetical protein
MFVQGKSSLCSRREEYHSFFSLEETEKRVGLFQLVGCSISSPYASASPPPVAYQSRAIESRAAVRVRRRRQEDEQEEVDEAKKPVVTPLRGKRNTGG